MSWRDLFNRQKSGEDLTADEQSALDAEQKRILEEAAAGEDKPQASAAEIAQELHRVQTEAAARAQQEEDDRKAAVEAATASAAAAAMLRGRSNETLAEKEKRYLDLRERDRKLGDDDAAVEADKLQLEIAQERAVAEVEQRYKGKFDVTDQIAADNVLRMVMDGIGTEEAKEAEAIIVRDKLSVTDLSNPLVRNFVRKEARLNVFEKTGKLEEIEVPGVESSRTRSVNRLDPDESEVLTDLEKLTKRLNARQRSSAKPIKVSEEDLLRRN